MSDPNDDQQDFSPRRGCVTGPALILALAVLMAALILIAVGTIQHCSNSAKMTLVNRITIRPAFLAMVADQIS
jgi:hypothetical protein